MSKASSPDGQNSRQSTWKIEAQDGQRTVSFELSGKHDEVFGEGAADMFGQVLHAFGNPNMGQGPQAPADYRVLPTNSGFYPPMLPALPPAQNPHTHFHQQPTPLPVPAQNPFPPPVMTAPTQVMEPVSPVGEPEFEVRYAQAAPGSLGLAWGWTRQNPWPVAVVLLVSFLLFTLTNSATRESLIEMAIKEAQQDEQVEQSQPVISEDTSER